MKFEKIVSIAKDLDRAFLGEVVSFRTLESQESRFMFSNLNARLTLASLLFVGGIGQFICWFPEVSLSIFLFVLGYKIFSSKTYGICMGLALCLLFCSEEWKIQWFRYENSIAFWIFVLLTVLCGIRRDMLLWIKIQGAFVLRGALLHCPGVTFVGTVTCDLWETFASLTPVWVGFGWVWGVFSILPSWLLWGEFVDVLFGPVEMVGKHSSMASSVLREDPQPPKMIYMIQEANGLANTCRGLIPYGYTQEHKTWHYYLQMNHLVFGHLEKPLCGINSANSMEGAAGHDAMLYQDHLGVFTTGKEGDPKVLPNRLDVHGKEVVVTYDPKMNYASSIYSKEMGKIQSLKVHTYSEYNHMVGPMHRATELKHLFELYDWKFQWLEARLFKSCGGYSKVLLNSYLSKLPICELHNFLSLTEHELNAIDFLMDNQISSKDFYDKKVKIMLSNFLKAQSIADTPTRQKVVSVAYKKEINMILHNNEIPFDHRVTQVDEYRSDKSDLVASDTMRTSTIKVIAFYPQVERFIVDIQEVEKLNHSKPTSRTAGLLANELLLNQKNEKLE